MSFRCHAESPKSKIGRLVSCRATIRPLPTVVNGKIVVEDVVFEEGSVGAVLTQSTVRGRPGADPHCSQASAHRA